MRKEILRMKDICYMDNAVYVVKNAHFHMFESEVVGLVGNNHAGKSTFIGSVTGEYPSHSGEIWINEKIKRIESIASARKNGFFLIKDESSLIDEFTIAETMELNFALTKKEKITKYMKRCKETLKLLEVFEDQNTKIFELGLEKRVLIELAVAIVCDAKVIVLDSVIGMLSNDERENLKNIFQMLKMRGIGFILIENQLSDIEPFIDRLYIMRKGYVSAELPKKEFDEQLVNSLIEGEKFIPGEMIESNAKIIDKKEIVLEFSNVYTLDKLLNGLDLCIYRNEILGIWNKSRWSDRGLIDVLNGSLNIVNGNVYINGKEYCQYDESLLHECGIMHVPEEAQLFSNMTLEGNICISALKKYSYAKVIPKEGELKYLVQSLWEDFFSKGERKLFPNQVIPDNPLIKKKVMMCRALAADAEIIVYNNPFLKLDMREREVLVKDILRIQKKGITQIIISSHVESLYTVCNRIIHIENGKKALMIG